MAEITIDELLKQRAALERRIELALAPLLREFKHHTGVPVSNVLVGLTDVTTVGSPRRDYALAKVEVTLEIENR